MSRGVKQDVTKGQQFGRLTTLEVWNRPGYWDEEWICDCVCGRRTIARRDRLLEGKTKSCGCLALYTAESVIRRTKARQQKITALLEGGY